MGIAATRTPDPSISRSGSWTCPLRVHTFVMCDATAHGDSVMSETRDILHRARAQREGDCDTRGRISPPEDWPSTANLDYPVWHADVPSAPWLHRECATTHTQTALCGAVQLWGGSHHGFCLTRPLTHSILALL